MLCPRVTTWGVPNGAGQRTAQRAAADLGRWADTVHLLETLDERWRDRRTTSITVAGASGPARTGKEGIHDDMKVATRVESEYR